MNITNEQLDLVRNGLIVRVATDCGEMVILNAVLYDRIVGQAQEDPRYAYQSVLNAWDATGSPDDLEIYKDLQ